MPSTAAALPSSWARTRPRSPSGTSDGSLVEPCSPREPHIRITRTPVSASRAIVPPHISDSSSGWANTARTVLLFPVATIRLDDPIVDADVLVDHSRRAETRHGAIAHAAPVEVEHLRQLVRHLLEIREHDACHAVVDHLTHGTFV